MRSGRITGKDEQGQLVALVQMPGHLAKEPPDPGVHGGVRVDDHTIPVPERARTVGLEAPLWNLDTPVVAGYLDSLMLDESLVFAQVLSEDGTVITRARPEVEGMEFANRARS